MTKLTHLDQSGAARMVDVSAKNVTARAAIASGEIRMSDDALTAIFAGSAPKGDVLAAARLAGIMAAKKTSELIPLCHPLAISAVEVSLEHVDGGIRATATIRTSGQTGAEMEALTAVSVALLTIYDMVKALDKAMEIGSMRLLSKTGGKSGEWARPA